MAATRTRSIGPPGTPSVAKTVPRGVGALPRRGGSVGAGWRGGIAGRLYELDQLSVGVDHEARGGPHLRDADDRLLEHALPGRAQRGERRVQVLHPEREMREAGLVHPARVGRRRRRMREAEELDAHPVADQIYGVEIHATQSQQRVARLTLDVQLVLEAKAEDVAVEAQRALEVRDRDADVRQAYDGNHAGALARALAGSQADIFPASAFLDSRDRGGIREPPALGGARRRRSHAYHPLAPTTPPRGLVAVADRHRALRRALHVEREGAGDRCVSGRGASG